jgi:hypothetical protein
MKGTEQMKEDKRIIIFISIVYVVGIILGTILGMMIAYDKDKELINNQYIELDNSREVIDKLTQENNKLETILNNYTIEERKGDNSHEQ